MTILTKVFSEKKGDKLVVPLVENEQLPQPQPEDLEAQDHPRIHIFAARAHRVSAATTVCLLFTALMVVGIGIFGGKVLYNQFISYTREQLYDDLAEDGSASFEGWAQIPLPRTNSIDDDAETMYDSTEGERPRTNRIDYYADTIHSMYDSTEGERDLDDDRKINKLLQDFFQENFEINYDEKYEKIDVPDFKDDRRGRFIHDFNTNMTGIIDITGHRCFVMPLNRENVLPPKSLFDLIHKMWDGYYKVDTAVVRKSMKVILPPITDTTSIGGYIATECEGLPIYKLEKSTGGIVKRSADLHAEAKFAQFAGKGITELDIINLDDVILYEKNLKH